MRLSPLRHQPYNYRGTVIRLDDSEKKLLMRWKVAVGPQSTERSRLLSVVVIVMQAYLRKWRDRQHSKRDQFNNDFSHAAFGSP